MTSDLIVAVLMKRGVAAAVPAVRVQQSEVLYAKLGAQKFNKLLDFSFVSDAA